MLRQAYAVGVLTLALGGLAIVPPAAAQFGRSAGAGFGGRGGFGGFGGRQTTINVAYPAYGYYGGYYPYNYGGAYFGGGWSGWGGWGYNSGPFGGAGYSLADIEMLKQQQASLNASKYNLENAQAVQAYQSANYYQQQAVNTYLSNMKMSQEMQQKYNAETAARVAASRKPPRPFEQLVAADGNVLWPEYAPANQNRAAVDEAIRNAETERRQNGQATVQTVNQARKKLIAYGQPALSRVRRERPGFGNSFRDFLNELDVSLDTLAQPPVMVKAGGEDTPPPPAPKP
jgi:hypothetical protein